MRILVATPFVPWPLIDGGRVAQFRSYEACRDTCEFHLLVPAYNAQEEENAKICNGRLSNLNVTTVRCFTPALPERMGRRIKNKLKRISVFRRGTQASRPERKPVPFYPFRQLPAAYLDELDNELAKDYDMVQVEYMDLLTLGPLVKGRLPALFVHLQLHFVYARRFVEATRHAGVEADYIRCRIEAEERAYLQYYDSIIVYSEVDQAALLEFCPGLDVSVSPYPCPEEPVAFKQDTGPTARFVFIASESHKPNFDGLCWFMREVWPKIRMALPEAKMEVIGRWSKAAQEQVPSHAQIRFLGFVETLIPHLQDKTLVVPLWIGSGIRTKILAAWGACCPVVTTGIGVEGLPGEPGEAYLMADDADRFVEHCVRLSQDPELRTCITRQGLDLVEAHYSLERVGRVRSEIYRKVVHGQQRS